MRKKIYGQEVTAPPPPPPGPEKVSCSRNVYGYTLYLTRQVSFVHVPHKFDGIKPSIVLYCFYVPFKLAFAHIIARDEFRSGGGGGGLKSLARIFFPLLARKSSGFARILTPFLPEKWLFEKF